MIHLQLTIVAAPNKRHTIQNTKAVPINLDFCYNSEQATYVFGIVSEFNNLVN